MDRQPCDDDVRIYFAKKFVYFKMDIYFCSVVHEYNTKTNHIKTIIMRKVFITLAVAVATFSANAQLLWKVTAPGSEKASYIVGTHHVAPAGMIDSVAGLRDAIAGVDKVYGEVEMADLNTPELQQKMMAVMMAPADSMLNVVLTKQEYDSVGAIITKYLNGMATIDQMAMLKPAAISTQIAMLQNMQAMPGFNPAQQFDTSIQALAKTLGKTTGGFETIEFQTNLLYGSPISEQAKDLMKTVRMDDKAIEMTHKLSDAYMKGDLEGLAQIMLDPELGMDDESAHKLIYERNANWVEELKKITPSTSVLVAVGAGHLPGEKGVISMLKKEGFTVVPVNNK